MAPFYGIASFLLAAQLHTARRLHPTHAEHLNVVHVREVLGLPSQTWLLSLTRPLPFCTTVSLPNLALEVYSSLSRVPLRQSQGLTHERSDKP
mmetsp:Transcript_32125/g.92221  ORF Transcript_32125/g.92221 Transcript_32125/m.92221 type:complete len:93 (+) Transcript_32125:219-497(+)